MKFRKLTPGVFQVEGTDLQIIKDGWEPVREAPTPGREHAQHFDHMYLGATEVVWIVMRVRGGHDDNLGMFDRLKDAKAAVLRGLGAEA